MNKDKHHNTLAVIGFSQTNQKRQTEDYYATDPKALEIWPRLKDFNNVWECAVGGGHLAEVLKNNNSLARVSDIIDRGYPKTEVIDFLEYEGEWSGDILTNPPYKYADEFIKKAIEITTPGSKIAMFLPIRYLEGLKHYEVFKNYPPKEVWISSRRLACAHSGIEELFKTGSSIAYGWFVWVKDDYNEPPKIFWFNT